MKEYICDICGENFSLIAPKEWPVLHYTVGAITDSITAVNINHLYFGGGNNIEIDICPKCYQKLFQKTVDAKILKGDYTL